MRLFLRFPADSLLPGQTPAQEAMGLLRPSSPGEWMATSAVKRRCLSDPRHLLIPDEEIEVELQGFDESAV